MAATKRNRIKADIKSKMDQKKLTSALYESQLEQYMAWYDQLVSLNQLSRKTENQKFRFECLKEIRQIQKSMQSILTWMGIDPDTEAVQEESYDL